ncbi:MAG: metallophosphoesterase [Deltaproteobacteria bacterium]|nr:metallophosphoesterase [Deltaproteobacteria bacterium]
MKIGLISDTHDNMTAIKKAVAYFNKERVDAVIHAGDFVAPFAADEFNKLNCPFIGVFGNNDGEVKGLTNTLKGRIYKPPKEIILGGKKIIIVHDIKILPKNIDADIVVYGHLHKQKSEMIGKTLYINPGEACGWLTGSGTISLLDTDTMEVTDITAL